VAIYHGKTKARQGFRSPWLAEQDAPIKEMGAAGLPALEGVAARNPRPAWSARAPIA
jgi:hypothetical protein